MCHFGDLCLKSLVVGGAGLSVQGSARLAASGSKAAVICCRFRAQGCIVGCG